MTGLSRPGAEAFTPRSPRVVAARRLLRRRHRDAEGLFLAEGPPAVREALTAGAAIDLFGTAQFFARQRELLAAAYAAEVPVWPVTDAALVALADTVSPQGVVAVCRQQHHADLSTVLLDQPRLVVVLAGIADPGNAGTILRTADGAGAEVVVFPAGSVDPYNGKCVRASAGSLFHLELVRGSDPGAAVVSLRAAGIRVLAADAHAAADLDALADAGGLDGPTAWLFGSEAHGLPAELAAAADAQVRVAIHGRAESLNLAAAAAVCLYASARAHRHPSTHGHQGVPA